MLHKPRPQRQKPPTKTRRRQPDPRRDFLQDQIIRNLTKHVSAVENGVDLIQLRALEAEVLFHARDVGVVEVGAVEVVGPVHEADVGEEEPVDFAKETGLFFCCWGFAPDDDTEAVEEAHFGDEAMACYCPLEDAEGCQRGWRRVMGSFIASFSIRAACDVLFKVRALLSLSVALGNIEADRSMQRRER